MGSSQELIASVPLTSQVAFLVLLSALLHAVWNALIKRERDPRVAGLAVLGVAAATAGVLALFSGANAFPGARSLGWALGAGTFEGGYFAALGLALARGPLGPTYTVARGGAMLVTWPLSVAFLGEAFPWQARAGALLIAGGLALSALRPHDPHGETKASSFAWAALCAVCIAGYHLCYKLALDARAEPHALFAVALACALPINAGSLGATAWKECAAALRRRPLALCAGGVACTASFLVFLDALSMSGAGAVLTLRNTSVLFAQLFALWSGERADRRVLGGAALVVGGAVLLAR